MSKHVEALEPDGHPDAAVREAWAHVADGLMQALKVPGLPPGEIPSLQRSLRAACELAGRPLISAAPPATDAASTPMRSSATADDVLTEECQIFMTRLRSRAADISPRAAADVLAVASRLSRAVWPDAEIGA